MTQPLTQSRGPSLRRSAVTFLLRPLCSIVIQFSASKSKEMIKEASKKCKTKGTQTIKWQSNQSITSAKILWATPRLAKSGHQSMWDSQKKNTRIRKLLMLWSRKTVAKRKRRIQVIWCENEKAMRSRNKQVSPSRLYLRETAHNLGVNYANRMMCLKIRRRNPSERPFKTNKSKKKSSSQKKTLRDRVSRKRRELKSLSRSIFSFLTVVLKG